MVKEHPILFSGPMVRAILDGRKTQTRRVLKLPRPMIEPTVYVNISGDWTLYDQATTPHSDWHRVKGYGTPGDRLWVRETFYVDDGHYANGERLPAEIGDIDPRSIYYRADGECCQQIPECQCWDVGKPKWRPSIFIRRWASRITLEITNVRVERLKKCSESDAKDEGAGISAHEFPQWDGDPDEYRKLFRERWDKINGKKYPWASNPWVWVIEFPKYKGTTVE